MSHVTKVFLYKIGKIFSRAKASFLVLLLLFTCLIVCVQTLTKESESSLLKRNFRKNKLYWEPCGTLECTNISVPINHLDPNSEQFDIAISRFLAKKQPAKKTVILHFDFIRSRANSTLEKAISTIAKLLNNSVNIVTFDQRGSGKSKEIKCTKPEQFDDYAKGFIFFGASYLPRDASQEEITYFDKTAILHSELCAQNVGEFLAYTSTANIARDLDLIRESLMMEKLNFWGIGKGGVLGATYAKMFPENVGQIIIENAPNLNLYYSNPLYHLASTLQGTDQALLQITDQCDKSPECPLYNPNEKSLKAIRRLIKTLRDQPAIYFDKNVAGIVTEEMAEELLLNSLGSPLRFYRVAVAFAAFDQGSTKQLYFLTSGPKTTFTDLSIFLATYCADSKDIRNMPLEKWMSKVELFEKRYFFSGNQFASRLMSCRHWKRFKKQERVTNPWNNNFANPILLIGNKFNPINPLEGMRANYYSMKGNQDISLLIHNGFGVTSFSQSSGCTARSIREYILNNILPAHESVCQPAYRYFERSAVGSRVNETLDSVFELENLVNDLY